MLNLLHNVVAVFQFTGAWEALVADCGPMAYEYMERSMFHVEDGVLWHETAVHSDVWDPAALQWVDHDELCNS